MPGPFRLNRAHIALIHDIVMAALAFAGAVTVRYGFSAFQIAPQVMLVGTAVYTGLAAIVFRATGLYRGIWRYASLDDFTAILKAATYVVLGTTLVLFLLSRGEDLPRSSLILSWFFLVLLLGVPRLIYRVTKDGHLGNLLRRTNEAKRIPVLLIGAGDESENFIREMQRDTAGLYRPIAILDDKGKRAGQAIRGVPIIGALENLAEAVATLADDHVRPQRLIVTRERLAANTMAWLVDEAQRLGLPLSRLPRLTDFRRGTGEPAHIEARPVDIEDLLNRPQRVLDRDAVSRLVAGKRVLVTGAGGSIGGELVRQLAGLAPTRLVLVDSSEFALYQIDLELGESFADLPRRAALADIRDPERLEQIFTEERPQLVFHAAALKHVPMAEANLEEYLLTNVGGTRRVADLARRHGVEAMVMISTDKAVNPTNIMGATKRLAESWCQALDLQDGPTRFITVRFGNVLGSTGSVVPLFRRQLAAGGPLTVTHPDITRYFMTIREAVELVLQASAHGVADSADHGKIFVLEMGDPVKIADLARQMIRLAGLRPDEDIKIAFTGLRPGEKLYEELFHDDEALMPTPVAGLRLAAPRVTDLSELAAALDQLEALARQRAGSEALALLSRLVPEYGAPHH